MKAPGIFFLIGALGMAVAAWAADSAAPRGTAVSRNAGMDLLKA